MSTPADALPETAAGEVAPVIQPSIQPNKPLLDAIDAWFNEQFHNSITSRDPQVFNHCLAAKEKLKRTISAL
jgi:hypothetical protein